MTKEVFITISGLQLSGDVDEEGGPIELITAGSYYKKDGRHYIFYDEVTEGTEGVTKNRIRLDNDFMDLTKKGTSNIHMIFEKNKKNVSYYNTPFGSLQIGVDAKEIKLKESEYEIDVVVNYGLEINYEYFADCYITMNVKSKEAGSFKI